MVTGKSKSAISKSKINFYLVIYEVIKSGKNLNYIVNKYSVKKQNLTFYANKLKSLGIIERVSKKNVYLGWRILLDLSEDDLMAKIKVKPKRGKSNLSLGTSKPISNLHALQIKIPILSGVIDDSDWEVKEKLKNWIPKYTSLKELGGLRLKNNNNKSLTVWATSRDIKNVDEVHSLTISILFYLGSYFKNKYQTNIDIIHAKVKNFDVATEDKAAEGMRGKGEKYLLNLNKDCEKILPDDDPRPAKAWIDGSPFNFSAETNDLDWKREYLNMPFNIQHMIKSLYLLDEYNVNLKLHIEVQQEQLVTQKDIQKLLLKLDGKL